ncbi:uncharacterized protein PFL1_02801 [Pseudozyma flocculosa PF-1]|uniref:Arrestin-like N-terminal domain-containing protein n=2 Tax=Pseudozyma flocculosa TaxID=84751 RepID=A0A5C3F4I4_9BASI|nr:uncharacterized protein PFL1_02801 [Pseudozyma flocculosa PF-1]EPQ29582.1 hypothetical protein PFL1_02801 [Pseudozyma flocculosa PF-1]SPO38131.1 uncharacterized protein PSFLO_03608 [Pseudozyma flocculosa]
MTASLLPPPATFELSVNVEARDIYLFPSRKTSAEASLTDLGLASSSAASTSSATNNLNSAIIYASCELTVPPLDARTASSSSSSAQQGRRRLKSLTLSLVGRETIAFPSGRYEQNDTHDETANFDESLAQLLADPNGLEPRKTYRFERSFFVDHCSAPYQRSKFGRNVIKVVAKATFHGLFAKTLTAEKRVYLIDCEEDTGNEMLWYERTIARDSDSIGPYVLDARSNIFTVGGYLRLGFELLSPPAKLRTVACRAYVVQRCTLRSRRSKSGHTEEVTPERVRFLDLSRDDIRQSVLKLRRERAQEGASDDLTPGDLSGPLRFDSLVRLPDDDLIRPSTATGNNAAIRFEHSIELELDYVDGEACDGDKAKAAAAGPLLSVDGQKLKRFRIAWPATIGSCVCRWGSMTLPPYACVDPSLGEKGERMSLWPLAPSPPPVSRSFEASRAAAEGAGSSDVGGCAACTCTTALDTLLEFERGVLRQQESEMLQFDSGYGDRPESWECQRKSEPRPSWSSSSSFVSR